MPPRTPPSLFRHSFAPPSLMVIASGEAGEGGAMMRGFCEYRCIGEGGMGAEEELT